MSDPLVVNDIIQARVCFYNTTRNQIDLNIAHLAVTTLGGAGVDLSELPFIVGAAMIPNVLKLIAPSYRFRGIGLKRVAPLVSQTIEYFDIAHDTAGSRGTDAVSGQATMTVKKRTSGVGRKKRGRFYMPPPSDLDITSDGEPSATYQTNCLNSLADWFAVKTWTGMAGTVTTVPVIYNRPTHTGIRVETLIPSGKFATQKRRGDYGRMNALPF